MGLAFRWTACLLTVTLVWTSVVPANATVFDRRSTTVSTTDFLFSQQALSAFAVLSARLLKTHQEKKQRHELVQHRQQLLQQRPGRWTLDPRTAVRIASVIAWVGLLAIPAIAQEPSGLPQALEEIFRQESRTPEQEWWLGVVTLLRDPATPWILLIATTLLGPAILYQIERLRHPRPSDEELLTDELRQAGITQARPIRALVARHESGALQSDIQSALRSKKKARRFENRGDGGLFGRGSKGTRWAQPGQAP